MDSIEIIAVRAGNNQVLAHTRTDKLDTALKFFAEAIHQVIAAEEKEIEIAVRLDPLR